jgi:hypothetical protein
MADLTATEKIVLDLSREAERSAILHPHITLRAIIQLLLGKRAQF